jgi:hypothetical protein
MYNCSWKKISKTIIIYSSYNNLTNARWDAGQEEEEVAALVIAIELNSWIQ